MDFGDYQKRSQKTAIYPRRGKNLPYAVLGLVGEAGEVADKLKKIIRDNRGDLSPERREMMADELADVLWYLAASAHELGKSLDDIAVRSIRKIESRKKRGVIRGEGDKR